MCLSSIKGEELPLYTAVNHEGDADSFAVSKDAVGSSGETIPYTLFFDPSINPGGGNNASMRVRFDGDDIKPKPAGSYSGVITIKVEPN